MKKILFFLFAFGVFGVNAQTVRAGQQYGQDAAGNTVAQPIGGKAISTRVPLAANATWSTPILLYNGNNNIQLAIQTNTFGSYLVEYYTRDSVKLPFMGTMTNFDPAVVSSFQAGIAGKGDGVKITYINGSTAQTSFYLEVGLLNNPIQATLRSVGANISASNLASVGNNVLSGRADSTTSASYRQATTSTIGNKVGIDMFVLNRSDTQKVSVVALPSTPSGNNIIGSVNINGTPTVNANVTFPSNQQVTISNASLPVTGTVTAAVDSTKQKGWINVLNPYVVLAADSIKSRSTVNIGNTPNINVTGFDSTKTRSIQLLSANASTASNQAVTNSTLAIIATNTTGGSTSALQTTGNSFLSSVNTGVGTIVDTAQSDQTKSATVISLLKGVLKELVAPATSGTFTNASLTANTAFNLAANTNTKKYIIFNPTGTLLIAIGFTATATNYTVSIPAGYAYEVDEILSEVGVSLFSTTATTVKITTFQ